MSGFNDEEKNYLAKLEYEQDLEEAVKESMGVCPYCHGKGAEFDEKGHVPCSYSGCTDGMLNSLESKMECYPDTYGHPFVKEKDGNLKIKLSKKNVDYFIEKCNWHINPFQIRQRMDTKVYKHKKSKTIRVRYKGQERITIPILEIDNPNRCVYVTLSPQYKIIDVAVIKRLDSREYNQNNIELDLLAQVIFKMLGLSKILKSPVKDYNHNINTKEIYIQLANGLSMNIKNNSVEVGVFKNNANEIIWIIEDISKIDEYDKFIIDYMKG